MTKEQKQMIANSVVQQYTREQGIQNLQAEIEAMNRQNGIAALQAELNAMNNAQPVQQAQSAQIPSLTKTQPKRDLQAEAREYFAKVRQERREQAAEEKKRIEIEKQNKIKAAREDYQRQQQEEQMLAEKKFTTDDLERRIANSDRAVPQGKKKKLTEEQKALEEQILSADRADIYNKPEKEEKKKYSANPFMSDYLSIRTENDLNKDRKAIQTDEVIKKYAEAKGITEAQARAEFEKAEAMKGQSISAPGERNLASLEATDKAQKELQTSKWLDPNKKLSGEEKKQAREFAQEELKRFEYNSSHQPIFNSDEERQHYAEMVNLLNKTSPLANTMTGVIQQPLTVAQAARDAGRATINGVTGFGAALADKTGLTEGATQRHNEKVAAKDALFAQNDASMEQAYQNALVQNPVLTKGGQFAGNMGMYMLTNPVFDSLGAAAGLGKAGSYVLNQAGQNLQDLALDTLPTLNRYMDDGTLSDQEKFSLLTGGAFNAAGNVFMPMLMNGGAKMLQGLEADKAARNAADEAFLANVREGAEKLNKLANPEGIKAAPDIKDYGLTFEPGGYKKALKDGTIARNEVIAQTTPEFQNVLRRLQNNENVTLDEIMSLPEVKYAEARVKPGSSWNEYIAHPTAERKALQEKLANDYYARGSATFDENGKVHYNGDVERGKKVFFVTGLPASGKSSTLVDRISQAFHARILDSDDIKFAHPEFDNGFGGNYIHKESKEILKTVKNIAKGNEENLVIPIIGGGETKELADKILEYQKAGWEVALCQNDLPSNKALGRALSRYITDGRYIPPEVLMEYGDFPSRNYKELIERGNEYGLNLSGFARVSNDVPEGSSAITEEAGGNLASLFGKDTPPVEGPNGKMVLGERSGDGTGLHLNEPNVDNGGFKYGTETGNRYDGTGSEGVLRTDSAEGPLGGRVSADGVSGGQYLPANRISVSDNVTKYPKVFDDADAQKLSQSNIAYNEYYDIQEPELFSQALETAKANNPYGAAVDSHTAEEIQEIISNGGKTFLTADGTAGGAVENGNLTAVFKDNLNNETPRAASSIAIAGVKNGATKGDCFGRFLANSYSRGGFEPVARMKYAYGFNDAMDAQVRDQLAKGIIDTEPDVYAIKLRDGYDYQKAIDGYNSAKIYSQQELDELPLFEDYDEMLKYRDSLIQEQPKQGAFFGGENEGPELVEKGTGKEKVSKYRTNSMEKLDSVNEQNAPKSDYGFKEFSVEEQKAAGQERWGNDPNAVRGLLNKEAWDEVDARYAQDRWTQLMEEGEVNEANKLSRRMSYELREGGRLVQTAAEMDDIASQLNEARRMINSRVDKISGAGTSEALDNFATKAEKNLENIDLSTKEGKDEAAKVMAEMMDKDMKTYAPTNKAMTSKQFKKANKLVSDIRSGKFKSVDDIINEVYKQNGGVPIRAENQKKIYDLLNKAADLEDGSREQEIVLAHAAKLANKDVPTTFGEKVRGILYMNMLGNFKTAVSRNAFGNLGYQALEQARSPIAAGVDRAVSKFTGKRSTLGWNKEKFKAYGQGLVKGAKEQVGDFASGLNTGRSGALGWGNALKNNKTTFSYSGDNNVIKGLSDLSSKAEFYVENAMKFGDRPFFEANYQQRQTELRQLIQKFGKENVAGLSAVPDDLLDDTIDMVSAINAADSVFQKQGKISQGLTDLRNGLGEISQGTVGVDLLSTAASPFTLTPGNMLERAVEYSPFGIVKNAVETARELKQGAFNQRRFVDEASRTILGLPVLGGAYALAKKGMINGGYSEDQDEKQAQIDDGYIEYGFNLPDFIPGLGGKSLDTSDIPVLGPFMQAGSAVAEEGLNSKSLLQGASAITAGSTMQGLRRAFGADQGFGSTSSVDNLVDTFKSSGTQLVPSLLRQTAQTFDPYKRDLGEYGTNQYYLNSIKNSIPGVRQTLPIKYDSEGNPVLQNQGRNLGSKMLENYLLPMNVSEYAPSELNQEAQRLLEATDSAIAFVPKAKRSDLRGWDDKAQVEYNEEQFRAYKQDLGTLNGTVGNAVIQSDFYKSLDDGQKAKVLSEVYSGMKQIAKENATGIATDDKIANAYKNGEIEGVINYLAGKDAVKESGYKTTSTMGKTIQEYAESGDTEAAYDLSEQSKLLPNYGLDLPGPSATYSKAYKVYGGMSAEEFAKTYKAIDRDHNQSLKKKEELLPYMNSHNMDYEEGMKFWEAYANKTWKIPELENNTWK